jgi:putative membrane protein
LGRLDWSWLRFAPLTVSSLAAVGAVAGAFIQFVGELGVEPAQVAELGGVSERLSAAPLWLGITVLALAVLVIAVLGALLIFVEAWWGFRLVREPGTLRIRRGLLTARSVSLEERRLRGVEVTEPLLIRVGHGARLVAVATGLGDGPSHGRGALLPPAPLDEAHRVAGLVLAEDPPATRAPLRRHPPAALRRRLVRAVLPVLLVAAVLGLAPALGLPGWLGWAALGLLPVTVLLALDAYRNLGHALTEGYLVARHGPGMRRAAVPAAAPRRAGDPDRDHRGRQRRLPGVRRRNRRGPRGRRAGGAWLAHPVPAPPPGRCPGGAQRRWVIVSHLRVAKRCALLQVTH